MPEPTNNAEVNLAFLWCFDKQRLLYVVHGLKPSLRHSVKLKDLMSFEEADCFAIREMKAKNSYSQSLITSIISGVPMSHLTPLAKQKFQELLAEYADIMLLPERS